MKFGDIVINTSAGLSNPNRKFMVTYYSSATIKGINKEGVEIAHRTPHQKKYKYLKVIGHINIQEQMGSFFDNCEMHKPKDTK